MPGLYLYVSNRLEILKDYLFQVVSEPLRSPLESEVIVVQSQGMERWLTHQLAEKAGIWANARFPFPNAMVWEFFQLTLGGTLDARYFSPEVLTWRILHSLGSCLERPGFESLNDYLGQDRNALKAIQLSERIADLFDQYTVYRPDMLLRWQEGRDEQWQAQLWRELNTDPAALHRAAIRSNFLERLFSGDFDAKSFPTRVSVFGISALPSFHLEIFAALSGHLPVHLFFMNPSREYWQEIASPRQIARMRSRQRSAEDAGTLSDYRESGNRLLASWGKMGRDFFAMLIDQENCEETAAFQDPGEETLLKCLQSDILGLRDRGHDGVKTPLVTNDDSLRIHSCHSPLREVEVLYDCLLDLFERHPGLTPHDVLVMTPSIETYAPFIAAVFGGTLQNRRKIPFSIADRSAKTESTVIQSFLRLLRLKGSRLGVDEVMDLLELPGVQRRFGLQSGDIGQIRHWVKSARIRWGVDGEDRERRGLPRFEENSWKSGLERLLLGYALPEEEDKLFEDILPFDDVEGATSQVLGRFAEFVQHLISAMEELARPKMLRAWCDILRALLSRFIKPDEESEMDFRLILHHFQQLEQCQELSGADERVDLESVRYVLDRRLEREELYRAFLSEGVTFCAMLPMRSIPAKVVALVGMNGAAFPRIDRPLPFDLIAQSPRKGDRSLRDEDRYLFLEALLSAREHLHVSYVGRSVNDNSSIPPSVLVSELVDAIDRGFLTPFHGSIIEEILTSHPLQAFSSAYFSSGDRRLFSFSEENFDAFQALRRQDACTRPFVSAPIAQPGIEWKHIDLAQLKRFFRNPAKFFCRERLGLSLSESVTVLDNREPLGLNGLDGYKLKQDLLRKRLAGKDLHSLYPSVKQQGALPPGRYGEAMFAGVVADVESLVVRLRPLTDAVELPPLQVDFDVAGFRLFGRLEPLWPDHLLHYRSATVKPHDRLELWIDHLVLNCCRETGYPRGSILVGNDGAWTLPPIPGADTFLSKLLGCFWAGLSQPLRFFSETSFEYASQMFVRKSSVEALAQAKKKWDGEEFNRKPGESEDAYLHLAFGKVEPLDEQFASLALEVFEPVLKFQKRLT
jgi:exodeoxyribonuclease V gamma subunit